VEDAVQVADVVRLVLRLGVSQHALRFSGCANSAGNAKARRNVRYLSASISRQLRCVGAMADTSDHTNDRIKGRTKSCIKRLARPLDGLFGTSLFLRRSGVLAS
jgi:hypothetical protein